MLAVDQGEEARFLAVEKFLDHHFRAGCTERAGEAGIDGVVGLLARLGDGHALAGGEPVGLDHDGQALLRDIGLGRVGIGEAGVSGGRDAVFARRGPW